MQLPPTPRNEFLRELVGEIAHNYGHGRVIVAVDGIDGAGKTSFGDDLAAVFREAGHDAFRASHGGLPPFACRALPRRAANRRSRSTATRSTTGRSAACWSTRSGWRAAPGSRRRRSMSRRDAPTLTRWVTGQPDGVLIVDGVFLQPAGAARDLELLDPARGAVGCRLRASRRTRRPRPGPATRWRTRGTATARNCTSPRRTRAQYASALVDNADPEHPRRIFADSC